MNADCRRRLTDLEDSGVLWFVLISFLAGQGLIILAAYLQAGAK